MWHSSLAWKARMRGVGEVRKLLLAAGGNFDGFRRDRGGANRSVYFAYVRTRGADETSAVYPASILLWLGGKARK